MNWKYILIVIILAVIVGGGILGYQYWWLPKQEVPPVTKLSIDRNPVLTAGKPSSPMNLVLDANILAPDELEIVMTIGKAKLISTEDFNALGVTANISLPKQLQLIEGKPGWSGDIRRDEKVVLRIKAKAVTQGEGIIEASAVTAPMIGSLNSPVLADNDGFWFGDGERLFVLVTAKGIRISETSFTPNTPESEIEPMPRSGIEPIK